MNEQYINKLKTSTKSFIKKLQRASLNTVTDIEINWESIEKLVKEKEEQQKVEITHFIVSKIGKVNNINLLTECLLVFIEQAINSGNKTISDEKFAEDAESLWKAKHQLNNPRTTFQQIMACDPQEKQDIVNAIKAIYKFNDPSSESSEFVTQYIKHKKRIQDLYIIELAKCKVTTLREVNDISHPKRIKNLFEIQKRKIKGEDITFYKLYQEAIMSEGQEHLQQKNIQYSLDRVKDIRIKAESLKNLRDKIVSIGGDMPITTEISKDIMIIKDMMDKADTYSSIIKYGKSKAVLEEGIDRIHDSLSGVELNPEPLMREKNSYKSSYEVMRDACSVLAKKYELLSIRQHTTVTRPKISKDEAELYKQAQQIFSGLQTNINKPGSTFVQFIQSAWDKLMSASGLKNLVIVGIAASSGATGMAMLGAWMQLQNMSAQNRE